MTTKATKELLVHLARAHSAAATAKDEVVMDESSERILGAVTELLELGDAAPCIAEATVELSDDFSAVDVLHELAQAAVEEDTSALLQLTGPAVDRLVLIPVSVSRVGHSALPQRLARDCVDKLKALSIRMLDAEQLAVLSLSDFLYAGEQLTRASYDQLYNLLPVLRDGDPLSPEFEALALQSDPVAVSSGHGVVRYLVGVLSSPVQLDMDFVMDENVNTVQRESFKVEAASLLSDAMGPGWRCLNVLELAPFFEGITMGEQFSREACFTTDVLMGLQAAQVSPRATQAHVRMLDGEVVDRVEVQLLGMDSIPVATAYWELLEPADPDTEIEILMTALERLGVRTKPDVNVISSYGTA